MLIETSFAHARCCLVCVAHAYLFSLHIHTDTHEASLQMSHSIVQLMRMYGEHSEFIHYFRAASTIEFCMPSESA